MLRRNVHLLAQARHDPVGREFGRRYLLGVEGMPRHVETGLGHLAHASVSTKHEAATIICECLSPRRTYRASPGRRAMACGKRRQCQGAVQAGGLALSSPRQDECSRSLAGDGKCGSSWCCASRRHGVGRPCGRRRGGGTGALHRGWRRPPDRVHCDASRRGTGRRTQPRPNDARPAGRVVRCVPAAPSSNPLTLSLTVERAVSIGTGVCLVVRSADSTAKPSMPGNITSTMTRSWSPLMAACSPSMPPVATSTAKPLSVSPCAR